MGGKRCILRLVCLLVALGFCLPTGAVYDVPTLFHNEEAWYKDSLAPLRMKEGRAHIPVDILAMFAGLDVTYSQDGDNVLIYAAETISTEATGDTTKAAAQDGTYVSLLFGEKTAVVNGELVSSVSVFRENGYTYIDAAWIAEIFELSLTYAETEGGQMVLRLSDTESARTLPTLITLYQAQAETGNTEAETSDRPVPEKVGDGRKHIYLVTGDNYENPEFPAAEAVIENSGLVCTMFLHARSSEEKWWEYALSDRCGLCVSTVAEADALNDMLSEMCARRLEYVLPMSSDVDKEAFQSAGYVVLEPDFVVDYRTDPDAVYAELLTYLTTHDEVLLQLSGDGCSQRMVTLLCNLIGSGDTFCASRLVW